MSPRSFRRAPHPVPLLAILLVLPVAARGQQAPAPRVLTLPEAVQMAAAAAPAAVQARGQVRTGSAAVRSAWGAFIPNVSLSSSVTQQSPASPRVNPATGELISGRYAITQGVSANVDLFDGLRRYNTLRSARAQVDAADAGEVAQRNGVAFQVKQQFYAVLATREAEAAATAQVAQAEQQLAVSVAKVRAATATRSDSLRAQIQLGQAQLALISARNDRMAADAGLQRLVGATTPVTASDAGLPDPAAGVPDSAALAAAVEHGPAVRAAEAAVTAARTAALAARSNYLPTLALSYARNATAADNNFAVMPTDPSYTGQLRLSLVYPLFNQFNREQGVVQSDVALANAEAALRDAQLAARQSLVQAFGAVRTAQAQIATQTATLAAAEEDLRVQQQRYQLGASTLLDVLTSQTQLNQARVGLVQARFAARTAVAQLEALVDRWP